MIAILGGGFVGTHLYNLLRSKYFNVFFLKRFQRDYTDYTTYSNFLKESGVKFVINCSGYTGHPNVDACESNKEKCLFYNVQGPINVCKASAEQNVKVIHVSSGCIYTGYDKDYTETDTPNFGIFNNQSSFYSKTKHIFELAAAPYIENTAILRVRMPYTETDEYKNYLYKLYNYDNLIDYKNSVTYLADLNNFIFQLLQAGNFTGGLYNVVNTEPIQASDVVDIYRKHNFINPNWKFVCIDDLKMVAGRSNCVLSNTKVLSTGFKFTNALESIDRCIYNIKTIHDKRTQKSNF
jgi:dTDP-4-dehydrorhamnose reductase